MAGYYMCLKIICRGVGRGGGRQWGVYYTISKVLYQRFLISLS